MPKISIIIRSFNEAKWIGLCLSAVKKQIFKDYEIILVDNNSQDGTLDIAKRFKDIKIITIDNFKPGLAINIGINKSKGSYIVCLSAHCIPKNKFWLKKLYESINKKKKVAGVYGRQIPLSYSSDSDKRDLLITFGKDKRIQTKDTFFHNANSIIPKKVWLKYKFDEKVNNIEDRVWAKKVISKGYKIIYEPESIVYHHHGIHHNNDKKRANKIISIMNRIDYDSLSKIPNSLSPKYNKISAFIPINKKINKKTKDIILIKKTIKIIQECKYIDKIYIISNEKLPMKIPNIQYIYRGDFIQSDNASLEDVLSKSLKKLEEKSIYPNYIIYFNYDYIFKPKKIINLMIEKFFNGGYDTVFPGILDYGHYWLQDKNGNFKRLNSSFKTRETKKRKNFKALYGLGLITSSYLLKQNKLFGERIGVEILDETKFSVRLRDYKNFSLN